MEFDDLKPDYQLDQAGLYQLRHVYWNRSTPELYELAIRRYEGQIAHLGPLVVSMGQHTGRAAKDKYVVDEPATTDEIWWGKVNVKYPEERFNALHKRMANYMRGETAFVQDCYAGADQRHRQSVRVITEFAWHNLFARNMFIQLSRDKDQIKNFVPDFTVLHCPNFRADPGDDETRSGTLVALHLRRKLVLIGGTAYAGEIKKSIFTALNFLLPDSLLDMTFRPLTLNDASRQASLRPRSRGGRRQAWAEGVEAEGASRQVPVVIRNKDLTKTETISHHFGKGGQS